LTSAEAKQDTDVCILCQDDTRINAAVVAAAFVQLSSVLSKERLASEESVKQFGAITIPAG